MCVCVYNIFIYIYIIFGRPSSPGFFLITIDIDIGKNIVNFV